MNKDYEVYKNKVNNAQGHLFESGIISACNLYLQEGKACIHKIPEGFRVKKKHTDGTFTGWFTAAAMPDFQGVLKNGRSICFEAKYTTTKRLCRNILTDNQMNVLNSFDRFGAVSAVCVGIQSDFFFIPWQVWRDMKLIFKRQYVTAEDIKEFRIRYNGAVLFLDNLKF